MQEESGAVGRVDERFKVARLEIRVEGMNLSLLESEFEN